MRMDKLTTKFQQALADAQSLAVGRDNQYIEPVHLMTALLDQEGGTARPLLEKAGAQVAKLRSDLAGALDRLWQQVLDGQRRFKLYRQLKMYNDPALNPAVYSPRPKP